MPANRILGAAAGSAWHFLENMAGLRCLGIVLLALAAHQTTATEPISGWNGVDLFGGAGGLLVYAAVSAEIYGVRFRPLLLYFGSISYSLYVWHRLIFLRLASFAPQMTPNETTAA